MIPKIIHYCWFGHKPLPELALRCIESWRRYLPDYEIRQWNEDNFDVNIIPYTAEAYRLRKYAFVSDFARFWILYNYGGVYFDTDVEVVAPMDHIIGRGAFMGIEAKPPSGNVLVASGLGLGMPKGHAFARTVIEEYSRKHFTTWHGKATGTVVNLVSAHFRLPSDFFDADDAIQQNGVYVYPPQYFCPINAYTGAEHYTDRTVSAHLYAASWVTGKQSLAKRLHKRLSYVWTRLCVALQFRKPFSLP